MEIKEGVLSGEDGRKFQEAVVSGRLGDAISLVLTSVQLPLTQMNLLTDLVARLRLLPAAQGWEQIGRFDVLITLIMAVLKPSHPLFLDAMKTVAMQTLGPLAAGPIAELLEETSALASIPKPHSVAVVLDEVIPRAGKIIVLEEQVRALVKGTDLSTEVVSGPTGAAVIALKFSKACCLSVRSGDCDYAATAFVDGVSLCHSYRCISQLGEGSDDDQVDAAAILALELAESQAICNAITKVIPFQVLVACNQKPAQA